MRGILPVNFAEREGMPMDLRMEYEVLLLQLGSLARKQYYAKQTLKEHEEQLERAIKRLEKETLALEKEERDLFSTALLKLIDTFKRAFSQDEETAISAKLEFDKAYTRKIASQRRLLELEAEIEEKKNRLRDVKETLLRRNPEMDKILSEKDMELVKIQHEYTHTLEAEAACYQVLESITDILANLDLSETISSWDTITEIDLLLKYVSRDQLDAAEAMILNLERNVQTLERELKDLHYIYENQYQVITSARPAIEEFFSSLFSDWSTKETVEKNLQHLKALEENVNQIMDLLGDRKRELEKVFTELKK